MNGNVDDSNAIKHSNESAIISLRSKFVESVPDEVKITAVEVFTDENQMWH